MLLLYFHQLISQRFSGEFLGSFLAGTEEWTEKRRVFLRSELWVCSVSKAGPVRRWTLEFLESMDESALDESAWRKALWVIAHKWKVAAICSPYSCLHVSVGVTHQEMIVQDTSFGQLQTLHRLTVSRFWLFYVLLHILLVATSITENYCPTPVDFLSVVFADFLRSDTFSTPSL